MIKLICFVKRKPGMSPEDFHAYWRDTHGPLVASTKSGSYVRRYEQNPKPLDHYGQGDDNGYDGCTIQWFDSTEAFYASIAEDDYKLIEADIPNFMDTNDIVFLLSEEPRVVMDGPTS